MFLPEQLAELERRIRARHDAAVADLRGEYEARLRRVSEELLAGLGTIPTPGFRPLTEADAADLVPREAGRDQALADLVAGARALDAATSQAGVLQALLDAARRFADRAGLLLLREDGLAGWASSGFDGDPFSGRELAWDESLPAPADLGHGALRLDSDSARRFAARLEIATAPARAVLVPLVLRDRVAAALYADRTGEGEEPPLGALQLLVQLAAARLELQPLCERGFTPTLYEPSEAPAAALPLWIAEAGAGPEAVAAVEPEVAPPPTREAEAPAPEPVLEPAAAAPEAAWPAPEPEWWAPAPVAAIEPEPFEPAPEAPVVEAEPAWAEPAPMAAEPAAFEPEPEPPAFEPPPTFEPLPAVEPPVVAEPLWTEPEAPAAPAVAPGAEAEIWSAPAPAIDAVTAGFAIEPEPPSAPVFETPPPPTPVTTAPVEPLAPVGEATVRIPVYRPEPVAEPTPPPAFGGLATQQVPKAAPPLPPRDVTEDATVLVPRAPAAPTPPLTMPPPAPEEEVTERTAVRGGVRTTEVAPPPDVSGPGLAFAAGRAVRTTGENALHEEARRLARLLVSEIKLYNEEQVLEGRRNRDLYVRLKEDIDRSRQIYDERVHESVRSTTDYFHQELVRSLAGGDARALGL